MLGFLALGAFLYFSKRPGGLSGAINSAFAVPRYGTAPATVGAPTQRYMIPPAGVLPAARQSAASGVVGVASQLLNLFSGARRGAPSASGLPTLESAANPHGWSSQAAGGVGLDTIMADAYSFGGPSSGVYGVDQGAVLRTEAAPWGSGVVHGPSASYYGQINNPATFTGDPYSDGGGADSSASSPAPNWDWNFASDDKLQNWTRP